MFLKEDKETYPVQQPGITAKNPQLEIMRTAKPRG